ncbi:MAG: hypothetical protein KAQ98_04215 [Bacteriovoracaceae bacterium]|nr:hypothetical protein [Bacteriovoracaceae bacterium]
MKVFYHNDMDGRCAAFCVYEYYLGRNDSELEFIEMNYNMPFPFDDVHKGEEVWIVDYSIDPDEMDRLLGITKNIHWIDHHVTAINKFSDYKINLNGIRLSGIAGCALTYKYIKKLEGDSSTIHDLDGVPEFIRLVHDRDVWKWEHGNKTGYFHLGMLARNTHPTSKEWQDLASGASLEPILAEGRVIQKYRDQWASDYLESWGMDVIFEGHRCMAMNIGSVGSEYFESVRERGYDIVIPFIFDGEKWSVSLFSLNKNVDVSKLAAKYGGGGHMDAAGFTCRELPFERCG